MYLIFDTETSVNAVPTLGYGKHKFDVILIPHSSNSAYPKLQPKSRVLFEVKDVAGNLIFSDITPIYKEEITTMNLIINLLLLKC